MPVGGVSHANRSSILLRFFGDSVVGWGLAEAGDEALQKAKSTFDDMKMKQDDLLEDAFTKAIADATKAGSWGMSKR